jgi:hypothetical protein
VGRHSSEDMSAETTLLPVARLRPLWLAGLGALLVLAVLIGGVILAVSRSGGGRVVADDPGGPLAAGSRSADPPGSPGSSSGALPESPPGSAVASSAASPRAKQSPTPRPSATASAQGGTAPVAGLSVAFAQTDSWPDGYQARYTITNRGTVPVSGWTVAVTFSGSGDFQWWDTDATTGTNRQLTFKNMSYNSTVPAGGSVTFGLLVRGSPPPTPTACTVNGHAC